MRPLPLLLSAAVRLAAQQPDSATIRVTVADSAHRPLAGAEVSIVHGLNEVRAVGSTDETGARTLRVARQADAIEVVARRIGYSRQSIFVTPRSDALEVALTLTPIPQQLAPVRVTSREDVKRRAFHVDADEIANSSRLILNGMDVITKIKPDIFYGRAPGCAVSRVWVNGRRIVAPLDPLAMARLPRKPPPRTRGGRRVTAEASFPDPFSGSSMDSVASILTSIKPEHIAEMNFADCFDTTVDKLHAQNALFVVLKEGIGFEPGVGSYVIGEKRAPEKRPVDARRDTLPLTLLLQRVP